MASDCEVCCNSAAFDETISRFLEDIGEEKSGRHEFAYFCATHGCHDIVKSRPGTNAKVGCSHHSVNSPLRQTACAFGKKLAKHGQATLEVGNHGVEPNLPQRLRSRYTAAVKKVRASCGSGGRLLASEYLFDKYEYATDDGDTDDDDHPGEDDTDDETPDNDDQDTDDEHDDGDSDDDDHPDEDDTDDETPDDDDQDTEDEHDDGDTDDDDHPDEDDTDDETPDDEDQDTDDEHDDGDSDDDDHPDEDDTDDETPDDDDPDTDDEDDHVEQCTVCCEKALQHQIVTSELLDDDSDFEEDDFEDACLYACDHGESCDMLSDEATLLYDICKFGETAGDMGSSDLSWVTEDGNTQKEITLQCNLGTISVSVDVSTVGADDNGSVLPSAGSVSGATNGIEGGAITGLVVVMFAAAVALAVTYWRKTGSSRNSTAEKGVIAEKNECQQGADQEQGPPQPHSEVNEGAVTPFDDSTGAQKVSL